MRALVLAWRAERLATTRTRIASTAPSARRYCPRNRVKLNGQVVTTVGT